MTNLPVSMCITAKTTRWPNVVLVLAQRRIKNIKTIGPAGLASTHKRDRWNYQNIKITLLKLVLVCRQFLIERPT